MIRSNRSKSTLNNVFKTLNHTSNTFNISNSSRSGCSRSVRDQSKMIANRRLTTTRVLKVFLPNNKLNINQSIFVRHTSNSSSSASATVLNEESGENPTRKQRVPKRPSTFATYLSLTKPRLSSFVILSAGVGFAMAPVDLALVDFVNCVVGTSLTVASANAGNQWLEVEHDKKVPAFIFCSLLFELFRKKFFLIKSFLNFFKKIQKFHFFLKKIEMILCRCLEHV